VAVVAVDPDEKPAFGFCLLWIKGTRPLNGKFSPVKTIRQQGDTGLLDGKSDAVAKSTCP